MSNDSTLSGYVTATSTPPASDLSLDAIFQTLLVGLTGLDGSLVRPRWQPIVPIQPEPSVNWCALGVTQVSADDGPFTQHNPLDAAGAGSDTYIRHETLELLCSFYGPQGQYYAEAARDGLGLPQNAGTLTLSGVWFTGHTDPIRSVPELVSQQWRRRYDVTARFRREITRTYGIRNLLGAEIDVYGDAGEITAAIVTPH